jgi:hypothetical protein
MTSIYQKLIVTTASVALTFTTGMPSSSAASFTLTQSFFNPNPNRPDQGSSAFGSSVAINADTVLIGARFANITSDTFVSNSGAAYLFNGITGDLNYSFSYSNLGLGQVLGLGTAVAIDENKALIGTYTNGAYLFDATSGNLIQHFSRFNSNLIFFGSSVAIDKDKVLIGDLQNPTFAPISGAAFLFDAVNGNLIHSFFPPNPDIEDFFGGSIAIEDNKVLIGASGGGRGSNSTGAAFLFDAVNGNLIYSFSPPNLNIGDSLSAGAIEGNKVLISAPGNDTFGSNSGIVYLFDATSGSLLQTFSHPNPIGNEFFGSSVAINADKVLIGAIGDNTFEDNRGAAFLFDAVSGNLIQSFFAPSLGNNNTFFGSSVAISGDNLLIGAPGGGEDGAAFLFQPASTSIPEPSNVVGLSLLILGLLKKRKKYFKT